MKKKIIITGASSFIGYQLCQDFSRDYDVYAIVTKPVEQYSGIKQDRLNLLKESCHFVCLDITKYEDLELVISNIKPEYFIQHAGHTIDYTSDKYDLKVGNEINVAPLENIFKQLKLNGCEGIVITGTSGEYSNSNEPHFEEEECDPITPYGKSKLLETEAALQLGKAYGLPTRIVRVFNVYGKMDNSDKLIPTVVSKIKLNEKVDLSPCTQYRSFIHAPKLIEIYRFAIHDMFKGGQEIFNGEYKTAIRLRDFLTLICVSLNKPVSLLNFGAIALRSNDPLYLMASNVKLVSAGFRSTGSHQEEIDSFAQAI